MWLDLRGWGEPGIAYSNNDGEMGGFNERLSVGEDEVSLYLVSMGTSFGATREGQAKLTLEGGAELLWELFITPLQRK